MAQCLYRSHLHQQRPVSRQMLQPASPALHQQQGIPRVRTTALRSAAKVATAGPVLVADGVLVPAPATAQQMLSEHPGWSYTTALVKQQYYVIDWDLHIERLVRNMEVMSHQRPPAYAAFQNWRQMQDNPHAVSSALHNLLNPMVASALSQLTHSHSHTGEQQAMLCVALGDPEASQQQFAGGLPLTVLVWAKAYEPPPGPTADKVLVAGDPRPAARAKHCSWVVDRRPLEQLKQQAGADEVVLCDSSGGLLEGLASNFYVIADAASLEACSQLVAVPAAVGGECGGPSQGPVGTLQAQQGQAGVGMQERHQAEMHQQQPQQRQQQQQQQSGGGLDGLVLLTTGPAADALLGVTQQRVLQACEQLALPVVLQPARVDTTSAWREAFLTNCLKRIQPIQQVQLSDGNVWRPTQADAVVPLLQQQLEMLQATTDMRAWLL